MQLCQIVLVMGTPVAQVFIRSQVLVVTVSKDLEARVWGKA